MTNAEKFKAAHKLAKTYEGDYIACFALALLELNEAASEPKRLTEIESVILNCISNGDDYEGTAARCLTDIKEILGMKPSYIKEALSSLEQQGAIWLAEYPNGWTSYHYAL